MILRFTYTDFLKGPTATVSDPSPQLISLLRCWFRSFHFVRFGEFPFLVLSENWHNLRLSFRLRKLPASSLAPNFTLPTSSVPPVTAAKRTPLMSTLSQTKYAIVHPTQDFGKPPSKWRVGRKRYEKCRYTFYFFKRTMFFRLCLGKGDRDNYRQLTTTFLNFEQKKCT